MPNQTQILNTQFHALADPTRRAIVQQLCAGPATVSELAGVHKMALPSFVQHLRVLEKCRLVHSSKTGRVRTCEVDLEQLAVVEQWLGSLRQLWEQRFGRLDTLLSTLQEEEK